MQSEVSSLWHNTTYSYVSSDAPTHGTMIGSGLRSLEQLTARKRIVYFHLGEIEQNPVLLHLHQMSRPATEDVATPHPLHAPTKWPTAA